ncbi:exported hypothetical protein [Candidatus Sulfotelmatobacter kueseliae]|uniref:Uncharacterized protein n=1 Tax=Candidatus Sulfotelmatobacter kueseliae TaxID=2042962 RepID=A0A2U3KPH8_9BACT|nr:exported hypothetical protein [Candidatus Sulfotelmatobacter kueseliae]
MSVGRFPFRLCRALVWLAVVAALSASALPGSAPTVEELKARLSSTGIGDRPHLCVQIAQQQLAAADKLYAGAEVEKAQTALSDVVAYSELARDYAIQSHKREKQTEIAVRGMIRKLTEIVHSLGQADQPPVRDAISRLQHVRDDLLAAMFPKGAK